MKRTRRRLDTCKCIVVYEWDETLPSDQVTHTILTFENKCIVHNQPITGIDNDQQLYDNVLSEENGRKNLTHHILIDNAPSSIYDLAVDGTRKFKKNIFVSWDFTGTVPNRVLTITVKGVTLTQNQKNAIQNKLNQKFGISNVIFVNG